MIDTKNKRLSHSLQRTYVLIDKKQFKSNSEHSNIKLSTVSPLLHLMVRREAHVGSIDYYAYPTRISSQVREIRHKSMKIKIRKQELNSDMSQGSTS